MTLHRKRRARRVAPQTRPLRRGRRHQGAQAVLEMALIFPIMIALIFNFLAVMVLLEGQNKLQAATGLGTQAILTAPVDDAKQSCNYATQAFWGTIIGSSQSPSGTCASIPSGGSSWNTTHSMVGSSAFGNSPAPTFDCASSGGAGAPNYLNGNNYGGGNGASTAVQCTSTATFDFSGTPLAVFVVWRPHITVTSQAVPTTVRQCNTTLTTC